MSRTKEQEANIALDAYTGQKLLRTLEDNQGKAGVITSDQFTAETIEIEVITDAYLLSVEEQKTQLAAKLVAFTEEEKIQEIAALDPNLEESEKANRTAAINAATNRPLTAQETTAHLFINSQNEIIASAGDLTKLIEGGVRKTTSMAHTEVEIPKELSLYMFKTGNEYHYKVDITGDRTEAEKLARYGNKKFREVVGTNATISSIQLSAMEAHAQRTARNAEGHEGELATGGELVVMAPGTGKTRAMAQLLMGHGLIVVPEVVNANGAIDDIACSSPNGTIINNWATNPSITAINPNHTTVITFAQFNALVEADKLEPDPAKRVLSGLVIAIDEVQQLSGDRVKAENLRFTTKANKIIGVTGTANATLEDILEKPICDLNLKIKMDKHEMRRMEQRVPSPETGDLDPIKASAIHHMSNVTVLSAADVGFHVITPKDTLEGQKAEIIKALRLNIYCDANQKNFAFCSDPSKLEELNALYTNPSAQNIEEFERDYLPKLKEKLTTQITGMCEQAGLPENERPAFIAKQLEAMLSTNPYVVGMERAFNTQLRTNMMDLTEACLRGTTVQKYKIACYKDKGGELGATTRTTNLANLTEAEILASLKREYKGLPDEQYAVLAAEVFEIKGRMSAGTLSDYTISPEHQTELGAKYAVKVLAGADFKLDASRAVAMANLGLTMNVLNDDGLRAGISIADVLCTQLVLTGNSTKDSLNTAENISQACARSIRAETGKAAVAIFAPPGVTPTFTPEDMMAADSGSRYTHALEVQNQELLANGAGFAQDLVTALSTGTVYNLVNNIERPIAFANSWDSGKTYADSLEVLQQVKEGLEGHIASLKAAKEEQLITQGVKDQMLLEQPELVATKIRELIQKYQTQQALTEGTKIFQKLVLKYLKQNNTELEKRFRGQAEINVKADQEADLPGRIGSLTVKQRESFAIAAATDPMIMKCTKYLETTLTKRIVRLTALNEQNILFNEFQEMAKVAMDVVNAPNISANIEELNKKFGTINETFAYDKKAVLEFITTVIDRAPIPCNDAVIKQLTEFKKTLQAKFLAAKQIKEPAIILEFQEKLKTKLDKLSNEIADKPQKRNELITAFKKQFAVDLKNTEKKIGLPPEKSHLANNAYNTLSTKGVSPIELGKTIQEALPGATLNPLFIKTARAVENLQRFVSMDSVDDSRVKKIPTLTTDVSLRDLRATTVGR